MDSMAHKDGHNMGNDMNNCTMDMNNCTMNMDMGMKMYFHFGFEDHILFKDWVAKTDGAVFGGCVLFFSLALFYEILKYGRYLHLSSASVIEVQASDAEATNSTASNDSQIGTFRNGGGDQYERPIHSRQVAKRRALKMLSTAHLLQTGLHVLQLLVSYVLMLGFMTFNGWLCLSIILGAGVGYFLVGTRTQTIPYSSINDDHCN